MRSRTLLFFLVLSIKPLQVSASHHHHDSVRTHSVGDRSVCIQSLRQSADPSSAFPDPGSGFAYRGFLGSYSQIPATPAVQREADSRGIERWALRIFFAPDLASAEQDHNRKMVNVGRTGVYVLGNPPSVPEELRPDLFSSASPEIKTRVQQEWTAAFNQAVSKGVFYFQDGQAMQIDPAFVTQNLLVSEMSFVNDKKVGPFLSQPGWCCSKVMGVLPVYKVYEKRDSIKRIHKILLFLLAKGYEIRINSSPEKMIEGLTTMERQSGQDNHYDNPELARLTYNALVAEHSFGLELWHPRGEMISGIVLRNRGDDFSGEGVFYPDRKVFDEDTDPAIFSEIQLSIRNDPDLRSVGGKKLRGIDFALALYFGGLKLLANAKIEVIDVSMVTDFTEILGAVYLQRQTYKDLMPGFPRVDKLETNRVAIDSPEAREQVLGLLRAKSKKGFDPTSIEGLSIPEILQYEIRDYSTSPVFHAIERDPVRRASKAAQPHRD